MNRQFRKLLRDLWLTRGRVAFMILALGVGLSSLGTILYMYGLLSREMSRNYLDTMPASATFDIGGAGVSTALLDRVRARPEVAAAERRTTLTARWRTDGTGAWNRALLFVIENFEDRPLARLGHEAGARTPGPAEVLVERGAMAVLGAQIGDVIQVQAGGGAPIHVTIAGVVHEPALAPAAAEQAAYLYASTDILQRLGQPPVLDELRVVVAENPFDAAAVATQVETLTTWLAGQGVALHEIRMPPPGRHPHESQSQAILLLLVTFAGLTVLLAAVLSASLLSITLARQVREIAVMKTLGATSRHIFIHYGVMLALISGLALVISVPATLYFGRQGIASVATLLNFDIATYAVPSWLHGVQVLTALILPLLTATPAILGASRAPVHQALSRHGASAPRGRELGGRIRWPDNRLIQAALRNALRVPRRLALTVGLLAVGGGLFVSALSIASAWEAVTEQVFLTRHYDVELALAADATRLPLDRLPQVDRVEIWATTPVTPANGSGIPLSRTYPDGGHGSFNLMAVPDDTELVSFKLTAGRWLRPDEEDGIVVNQMAAALLGPDPLGRQVDLVAAGKTHRWRVVGMVEEVASPAVAYTTHRVFAARTGESPRVVRLAMTTNRAPEATRAAVIDAQEEITRRGTGIISAIPLQLLFNAMAEHVVVLIRLLVGLAVLMAIVGLLALGANMNTSVVERTREIGVLRAIGARPGQIRRLILVEGLFVTLLSLPLALLFAVPVAALVGRIVGELSFRIPLPLEVSWTAMAIWTAAVLPIAAIAALLPTRMASGRTVRSALDHV